MTTDSLKIYELRRQVNQSNTGWWFRYLDIYLTCSDEEFLFA